MLFYEGNIAEGVSKAKNEAAVFVVAIFGDDDGSRELEEALNHVDVQRTLEAGRYVCIRITANSTEHQQFSQIYLNAPAPSIYLIGNAGQSLEVVASPVSVAELKNAFVSAWNKHSKPSSDPQSVVSAALRTASAAVAAAGAGPSSTKTTTSTQQALTDANEALKEAEEAAGQSDLSLDDKISRANQLAMAKRQQKAAQAAEDERQRERERREMGKGVAELKRWQEEQEAKLLVEQRKKEKKDDEDLRKRVKEQIAQDRLARNARTNVSFLTDGPTDPNQQTPVSTTRPAGISVTTAPVNYAGKARLQFRLPGGSSVSQVFEPELTLGDARNFLINNNHVPFRQFTLSIAYPRRQFASSEYVTSLRDLGLVPSAALLVLPVSGGNSMPRLGGASSIRDYFTIILGYLFIPFTFIYSLFQRALLPAPPSPTRPSGNPRNRQAASQNSEPVPSPSTSHSSASANAGGDASSAQVRNRKANKAENSKTTDGNIHRLRNQEDSDDEKTWNGNSTQQM